MFEKIGLAALIIAGASAGWMWPGSSQEPGAGAGQLVETISRSGDGHFYVNALVNGKSVRFLIDTGASTVALSEADARNVGLSFDPTQFELLGQGASGHVRGSNVKLETVQVGRIGQKGVAAAVIEGADVSLLGLPFLMGIDEIVIRGGEMELRDNSLEG